MTTTTVTASAAPGELAKVRLLVGQLFRDASPRVPDGAGDLAVPLFVVEGVDGAGKTTFTDGLIDAAARAQPSRSDLRPLRLGQRDQVPAAFRAIYADQILAIVEAGRRFAEITGFLLEIATLDVLLYRIRLRAARLAAAPCVRFVSDSWSYRRFCKFVLLAHCLAAASDIRRSAGVIEQLYAAYRPTFVASGGVVLVASRAHVLAAKQGRFTPWETIALDRDAASDERAKFLAMIDGTAALLSEVSAALRWPVIARTEPLPSVATESTEFTALHAMVTAWAS